MIRALILFVLLVASWGAALEFTSELSVEQRAVLFATLPVESAERSVLVSGVNNDQGVCVEAPSWLHVTAPAVLPAGESVLFATVALTREATVTRPLTICIQVGEDPGTRVLWTLLPTSQPLLTIHAPTEVVADTVRATTALLEVENRGGADALVEFTFRGPTMAAPATLVPAGSSVQVPIRIPPLPAGRQTVVVTARDAEAVAVSEFEIVTLGAATRGYGVTLGWHADTTHTPHQTVTSGRITAHGQLTRRTNLSLSMATDQLEGRIYHDDTTLIFNSEAVTVAGRAKNALHLEHTTRDVLDGLTIGAILDPAEQVRVGARLLANGFRVHANTDFRTHHYAQASYTSDAFQIRGEWDSRRANPFTVRVATFTTPWRFTYRLQAGRQAVQFAQATYDTRDGGTRVTFNVTLRDLQLDTYALELAQGVRALRWTNRPAQNQSTLTYQRIYGSAFYDYGFTLSLPLHALERSSMRLSVDHPIGVWLASYDALLTAEPDISLEARASRSLYHPSARHDFELGINAHKLLTEPEAHLDFGYALTTESGFTARLEARTHLTPLALTRLKASAGWSVFIDTPKAVQEWIHGPDPTERHVRVLLDDGVTQEPLPFATVLACGREFQADEHGVAIISGFPGACEVTLSTRSAPYYVHTQGAKSVHTEPRSETTLVAPKRHEVTITARWVDAATDEPLPLNPGEDLLTLQNEHDQQPRAITLTAGQATTWLTSGTYQATVRGIRLPPITVDAKRTSLELLVPIRTSAQRAAPPTITATPTIAALGQTISITIAHDRDITHVQITTPNGETTARRNGASWEATLIANALGALPITITTHLTEGEPHVRTLTLVVRP